jgi:hypothetical protein
MPLLVHVLTLDCCFGQQQLRHEPAFRIIVTTSTALTRAERGAGPMMNNGAASRASTRWYSIYNALIPAPTHPTHV